MALLALNTSGNQSEIALIGDDSIIAEKSWHADNNESEKLMPELQQILENAGLKWSDIGMIAVIIGPGPFTALRVSVAIANALAFGLGVKIVGIQTIDYWQKRADKYEIVINAGGNKVWNDGELIEIGNLKVNDEIAGVLKEKQIEFLKERGMKIVDNDILPTFGEVIYELASGEFENFEKKDIVKPLYFTDPKITKSKKAYK